MANFNTIQNLFDLRSDVVDTNVITRGHNLKAFIQPLNFNTVKYSFFYSVS